MAHSRHTALSFPARRHLTALFGAKANNQHCERGWIMTYDADATIIERLRTERRRHGPQNADNQTPAIKMLIGEWQVDEHGILTREIKARD